MPEVTLLIVDTRTGSVLVDDEGELGRAVQADLAPLLGAPQGVGCARPLRGERRQVPASERGGTVRIAGYWHDSLIEGPGRRSVVQMQGCPIHCVECWVPETWKMDGGTRVNLDDLVAALLDPAYPRDGVTIIGGEPFAQPVALAVLVTLLRQHGCRHITVYSGYTVAQLREQASADSIGATAVRDVLENIDLLIDGPYIEGQADTAGAWTGSGNQQLIRFGVDPDDDTGVVNLQ